MKKIISNVIVLFITIVFTGTSVFAQVAPWSKNAEGKFVNGNGEVMEGATMKGIDVSKWNGDIDWQKVLNSDVDFAIIRCGYGDNITSQDDAFWQKNATECEKYGIPYGVYIYSYAQTTKQALSEADHVLRLVKGRKLTFPIYYDMEDKTQEKLTTTQRGELATTFLNEISKAGYPCGVYANLNWWNNLLPETLGANTTMYKWVAQYNNVGTTYKGSYQMWQCTSQGRVDGIYGDVDINFWFGEYDKDKLLSYIPPKAVPKKVTAPKNTKIKSIKKGTKKLTVKVKKVSSAKGYRIQYSTSKKFKNKKNKYSTKTTVTIKKLKKKKTYYLRTKAYKLDSKKKVYSNKWSAVKKAKTK